MASDTSNEFTGLPMSELIGGPLAAACEAQVRLARATADFINSVGFVPEAVNGADNPPGQDKGTQPAAKLVPRQIDFSFWRPVPAAPDANNGNAEANPVQRVVLSVPLLAIVNVPALTIKEVDVAFDMEVKSMESSRETDDRQLAGDAAFKLGIGPFSAQLSIHGSIATHKENTRSTDKSAKYHVELRARDDGMPEGLARVLDIIQSAVVPLEVSKPITAAQAQLGTKLAALPTQTGPKLAAPPPGQ